MPLAQFQALLQFVQHRSPTGVDAEVLESQLEVWDIGFDVHPEELPCEERAEEEELLRHRENQRSESGDVGF